MVLAPEAAKRMYEGVWICMRCNIKNRSGSGKPRSCRKCKSIRLRPKRKLKKKA